MSASVSIAVLATAPNATVELRVPRIASTQAGTRTRFWQMRTPAGARFGAPVFVTINVPAPIPATGFCVGAPQISSFTVSPTTSARGQAATLIWGFVNHAEIAEIDNGSGGVATPGSTGVVPSATTTYTLRARCGAAISAAQTTVIVNPSQKQMTRAALTHRHFVFASPPDALCSNSPALLLTAAWLRARATDPPRDHV